MGTIICSDCNETIQYFDDEKVTVLYASSKNCFCHVEEEDSDKI
ncbi:MULTISPECIES: GapA-binding peptide SR1P [Bacillus]|uniref:GapA-binding peptide SR1P n=1 Tax=Bacillus capparidis TaxID=1840411 RepID=A0ABS4CS68_9BACI|nr:MULTISPECIES: GapA-binding peptide SR1P [Bacillus]MBP1079870.1 hypothetical protein [Bacillus capparidis]MED1095257.1 GapA-binding peptide SR1P [Bacillus capparidis]